jgi:hypothetical protein
MKTNGDLQGARRASKVVRGMNIVATIGGIIVIIFIYATEHPDHKPKP